MIIAYENLYKVKKSFERLLEKNNVMDLDYPFFNAYEWGNEVLFSSGYRSPQLAKEMADTSNQNPQIANAGENDVVWIGVFDGSRTMIPAKRY